jgi:phage-related protein
MADTPTMEVRARLTADSAQFVQGMNNATAAANQLTGTASRVQSAMSGIGVAAAAGMGGLIALGVQSFMAAARVQELDIAINAVGKSTGLGYDAINAAAHGIKDMGIEMAVAQRSALMFAQNNLKLADASKLARTAQDLAVLSGKNSTEEFQLLTYAVMTQRSELFKSAGVNGSVQGAYQKMAQTLGKSTASLTAAEKVQAAMNMALEEGAKVAGTYEAAMTSPGKVLRSFARLNDDLMVAVGGALLKGIGPMIVSLYQLEKTLVHAVEGSGAFHDVITALTAVMVHIFTPITKFIDGLKGIIEKFDKTKINTEKLAGALNNVLPILLAVAAGFAAVGGAMVFEMVPVLGTVLGMIAGGGGIPVALMVLVVTSTKVREAFVNLGKALMPIVDVFKNVGFAALNVLGYAVGAISKLINGLATVIRTTIGFIERFAAVFKILGAAIGIAAAAIGLYQLGMKAAAIATDVYFFAVEATTVAQVLMSGAQLEAIASTNSLAASMLALDATLAPITGTTVLIIGGILAAAAAIVYLYNTNATAQKVITTVFNTIFRVIGTVVGTTIKWFGMLVQAFGVLIDVHDGFGKVVAIIFQFVYTTILNVVQFVLRFIKFWLDAFVSLFEGHSALAKVVATVFKFVAEFIGGAINIVLQVFANVLKGIATLIHWFGLVKDFIGEVWSKIVSVISTAAGFIGNIVKSIANDTLGAFINFVKDKLTGLIDFLARAASKIPGIGGAISSFLSGMSDAIKGTTDSVKAFDDAASNAATSKLNSNAQKSIDAITTVGIALAGATQGWGNYKTGIEGTLSTVANGLSKAGEAVVNFTANLDPLKAIDLLVLGAQKASDGLGIVIDKLDTMKAFNVGTALVGGVSDAAKAAGAMLIGIGEGINSFVSGDVLGNMINGVGDLVSSLKETVGFGDILASLKDKFQGNPATGGAGATAADSMAAQIKGQTDQMQKIRDAMAKGIDAIKKVLDDLNQAAKDFANSLKDTIVGFAGLKGVQLPDGFIPQAKSLIENMQMKLNKATQFSSQIAQLQAMNLDAGALKQIIEAGPIQGAQLAASILSGGQSAVDEVSSLQRAIEFAGAAIGQQGVVAAGYPAMIATAQAKMASIAGGTLDVGGSGTNVNVAQGAFQVTINTAGATTTDEATKMIEDAIANVFATLGKELAAK